MREKLTFEQRFDSFKDAREFARDIMMNTKYLSRIHIMKKRTGKDWAVAYSYMSQDFIDSQGIRGQ